MIIRSIADFCLQYDEPLGLLRLEWTSGPGTQTMCASAAQLLQLTRALEVRYLLLDLNTVPDIPLEEELWLGTHWLPGIVALPLERLVLIIASDRVHNQLAVDALHDLVQPAIRFDLQYFGDPEAALSWLTDQSGRLPALRAEWEARHEAPTRLAEGPTEPRKSGSGNPGERESQSEAG